MLCQQPGLPGLPGLPWRPVGVIGSGFHRYKGGDGSCCWQMPIWMKQHATFTAWTVANVELWHIRSARQSASIFYMFVVFLFLWCSTCSQVTGRKSDSTAPRWWMGGHLPHTGINISMICWELLRLNVHCAFRKQSLSKVCASYPRIVLRQQAELQAHAEPGHGTQTCCPWIIRHTDKVKIKQCSWREALYQGLHFHQLRVEEMVWKTPFFVKCSWTFECSSNFFYGHRNLSTCDLLTCWSGTLHFTTLDMRKDSHPHLLASVVTVDSCNSW